MSEEVTVLRGGILIDGTGRGPLEDSVVIIRGSKISATGKSGRVGVPKQAKVIDVSGMTVMPGLFDLHVHLGSESLGRKIDFRLWSLETSPYLVAYHAVRNAQACLEAGFTTIRSMGGGREAWDPALRDAFEQGIFPGPRIFASALLIGMTAGHGDLFIPTTIQERPPRIADGPVECRKAVREQVRAGADFIKICTTGGVMSKEDKPTWRNYTVEEIRAITDEAHALERTVAAHAEGLVGIKNAIVGGVDTLEHGCYLDDEACEMTVERGIVYVPTLSIVHQIGVKGRELGLPEFGLRKAREVEKDHIESFRRAYRAGVKIALGTDGGYNIAQCGENALELELMVENGMSPMEAIVAGTKTSAEAIGGAEGLGTIEEGKVADVIVVDGDPLRDITVLQNKEKIRAVIKEGILMVNRGV